MKLFLFILFVFACVYASDSTLVDAIRNRRVTNSIISTHVLNRVTDINIQQKKNQNSNLAIGCLLIAGSIATTIATAISAEDSYSIDVGLNEDIKIKGNWSTIHTCLITVSITEFICGIAVLFKEY